MSARVTERIMVQGNHDSGYYSEIRREPKEASDTCDAHYIEGPATEWVSMHEIKYQPALESLLGQVRRISYDSFKQSLGASIKSIFGPLDISNPADYRAFLSRAVVLVEDKKSNQWVAELARKHFKFAAADYYRLGEKDARSFTGHIRYHADAEEKRKFEGKVIILFDDGSYSGKQIHDHVMALMKLKKDRELKFDKICVIVPYMTDHASEKVQSTARKVEVAVRKQADEKAPDEEDAPSDVIIAKSERIPTVAESVSREHAELLTELWWSKEDATEGPHSKGIIWFDHKIPNDQSFIGAIEKGNVINHSAICKRKFMIIPPVIIPYKS